MHKGTSATFILIRHAEKQDTVLADPGLSARGVEQAKCIARMLSLENITAIYSTPFNRTKETAQEVAKLQGLEVVDYNPFNRVIIREIYQKNIRMRTF